MQADLLLTLITKKPFRQAKITFWLEGRTVPLIFCKERRETRAKASFTGIKKQDIAFCLLTNCTNFGPERVSL